MGDLVSMAYNSLVRQCSCPGDWSKGIGPLRSSLKSAHVSNEQSKTRREAYDHDSVYIQLNCLRVAQSCKL